ncbi:MAG: ATP synthase F1 subunit delta [Gemmataceae bacterium]|nr:ATP synthase F1 subunit delta [Gemmataceae bacterium]
MAEVFESENRAGEEGSAKQRIARVYAEALMNVAEQRGLAKEVDQELQGIVTQVFSTSPEIERGLASPVLKRSAKTPILERAFQGKVSELLFNFLVVLNSKDRLVLVRNVAFAYSNLLDERAKRLRVRVRSAVPLTESQSEKLRQSIGQSTGLEVMLAAKVDASLLGGMIVQVGDKVFDSSVRTRIEAIRNQLLARSSYEIQAGRDRFSSRG